MYWIIATIILIIGVMYPIISTVDNYRFFWTNILFVFVFATLFRYIFLLKYTLIAYNLKIKLAVLAISFPLIILLIARFNDFRNYIDEQGIQSLFEHLSAKQNDSLSNYIKNETIFFSVASIMVSIMLPIRMLISVWRQYNKKLSI